MQNRKVGYLIIAALLVLIVVIALSDNSPTIGQDGVPVGFLPVISYEPTRVRYIPRVSFIPTPTSTPTPTPTKTPTPSPTPSATSTRPPGAPNLLPNRSFEEGWYHPGGVSELQIPNEWIFQFDEGYNPLDPNPDNAFVRPEVVHRSRNELPRDEWDRFIWDGEYTLKIFKGYGALSYRLLTTKYLEPGRYQLEVSVFPDLIVGYTPEGQKIWAPDPRSGEVNLSADGHSSGWVFPTFGQKNTIRHTFDVSQAKVVNITVAIRGRWAILNNGWFVDDWYLTRLSG
jgi:hypothetical protein